MVRENIIIMFFFIVKMPLKLCLWNQILICVLAYSEILGKMTFWKCKHEISPTLTPFLYLKRVSRIWLREVLRKESTMVLLDWEDREQTSRTLLLMEPVGQSTRRKELYAMGFLNDHWPRAAFLLLRMKFHKTKQDTASME